MTPPRLSPILSLVLLLTGVALTGSAAAQSELDADALTAAFGAQKAAEERTRSLAGAEKHRGLVIALPETGAGSGADSTPQLDEIEFVPVPEEHRIDLEIAFDLNSAALRPDQHGALVEMCKAMTQMADTRFRIIGHTDASGAESYNDQLSVHRAESVRRHLSGECGLDASRLEAVGVGERYPADPAAPLSARNRRVEFQAL